MFAITENKFMDCGRCKYMDELGNSVLMRRDGSAFVAKLRFSDERIKANPLHVDIDHLEEGGAYVHLEYQKGIDVESAAVTEVVSGFTELVQRWIDMLQDIRYLGADSKILMSGQAGKEIKEEDIAAEKMNRLIQYEELEPSIMEVFGGAAQIVHG